MARPPFPSSAATFGSGWRRTKWPKGSTGTIASVASMSRSTRPSARSCSMAARAIHERVRPRCLRAVAARSPVGNPNPGCSSTTVPAWSWRSSPTARTRCRRTSSRAHWAGTSTRSAPGRRRPHRRHLPGIRGCHRNSVTPRMAWASASSAWTRESCG